MTLFTTRMARWMYREGRPNRLARWMNGWSAVQFGHGVLAPRRAVTLEVRGRVSGRTIALPLVVAEVDGERYLVSMLGADVGWVRNVHAAGGAAVLRRRTATAVHLEEVPTELRAPILRRYLELAPGARPHLPVRKDAPLADFAAIADRYPVFKVVDRAPAPS